MDRTDRTLLSPVSGLYLGAFALLGALVGG